MLILVTGVGLKYLDISHLGWTVSLFTASIISIVCQVSELGQIKLFSGAQSPGPGVTIITITGRGYNKKPVWLVEGLLQDLDKYLNNDKDTKYNAIHQVSSCVFSCRWMSRQRLQSVQFVRWVVRMMRLVRVWSEYILSAGLCCLYSLVLDVLLVNLCSTRHWIEVISICSGLLCWRLCISVVCPFVLILVQWDSLDSVKLVI